MVEPLRPPPRPSIVERAAATLEFVGLGRLATGAVAVVAVAAGGWWLLRTPDPPVERSLPYTAGAGSTSTTSAASAGERAAGAPPAASGSPTTASTIVVQIAGAVARPGVYTMPSGSRVHELLARAGGAAPGADPNALALAAPLADGARVYVPKVGEVVGVAGLGAAPPGATSTGGIDLPIDLNRASADELDQLPGIGPATAQAIVAHRDQHGPFGSVDDLLDVRGIGPAKLDAIRGLVTT
jgi:competence protein ComEA